MDIPIVKIIIMVFFLLYILLVGFLLFFLLAPEVTVDIEHIQNQLEEKYEIEIPEEDMLIISKIAELI